MAYTKIQMIGGKADDKDISCAGKEFNKERRYNNIMFINHFQTQK